ncbi:primosomal protein N' [Paenibacillus sp. IB182496]|uniref:Replication restart protein PriA n=1 Tax=Paenibacillus sabuli TaxID=2772509 RepID=A0A927BSV5_9BACL|nr:primosomal protein N' [Paenibacillus sabuli]MBD2846161.1 primosomal protein N' [Paenibacillus sabuli]
MIARVIVDVPSRKTDRPFDYLVPVPMQEWVEVGSRVGVPFGGRVLQGFVVGFADSAEVDESRLKALAEVLDPVPPLASDLVELARWMSEKYCCTWTAALQAMIPSALRGKARRVVALAGPEQVAEQADLLGPSPLPEAVTAYIGAGHGVLLTTLLDRYPEAAGQIRAALRQGTLVEHARLRDRMQVRKVLTVYPPERPEAAREALAQLPQRAVRQRELLARVLELDEPIALQQLLTETGASAGSVRALADKDLLALREREVGRDPYAGRSFARSEPLALTAPQAEVHAQICAAMEEARGRVLLLQGVTGSGKTEVYLQAIERSIARGREAIVLVPEIALTPQMVERFKGRFGDDVAVLHSRLSGGERYDEWRKIKARRVRVAIGARSAIFAPFERIGLIIIDEEHESSYKQEESPKYHARDVAIKRARQHGAVVVLGSATPSLESYVAATAARPAATAAEGGPEAARALLPLSERVQGRPLPPVELVDMRLELEAGNRSMFSRRLRSALAERLERGEQAVLLLNRRGYSTFVMCRSCGYTAGCPHCDISLTYHQKTRMLRCHYCGHAESAPTACPSCESEHIRFFGTGTQRVEEELARLFPGVRVIRMDVDTTTEKGAHEKLLSAFGARQADVLLGTQMVAKGLDFPYVTLVGVIAADASLNLPDFRAAEKTFQLLTQVAGRAGRHHLAGEVVVQTYAPEHYSIQAARRHDYTGFAQQELRHRRLLSYPPYCRLALVTMTHPQLPLLVEQGERFAAALRELAGREGVLAPLDGASPRALEIFGPVASPIPRLKDRYRFQCMIKYRGSLDAAQLLRDALAPFTAGSAPDRVLFSVDVDPQVIM